MPSDKPLILFYTTFFSKPVNLAPLNGLIPDVSGQFTLDKRRIAEATAVVFHVPNFREMGDAFKHPGQYWIGWSMECRQNYKILADAKIMKRFDFTMTHETRSDVWAPYLPKASWWDQMMARPIPAKTEGVSVVGDWDPLGMRGTVSRTLLFKDAFAEGDAALMPRGVYFQAALRWPHMFLTLSPTWSSRPDASLHSPSPFSSAFRNAGVLKPATQ